MTSIRDANPDEPSNVNRVVQIEITGNCSKAALSVTTFVQHLCEALTPEVRHDFRQMDAFLKQHPHSSPAIRALRITDLKELKVIRPLKRPGRRRLEEEEWQGWREVTERVIQLRRSGKFTSEAAASRFVGVPYGTFRKWKAKLGE